MHEQWDACLEAGHSAGNKTSSQSRYFIDDSSQMSINDLIPIGVLQIYDNEATTVLNHFACERNATNFIIVIK